MPTPTANCAVFPSNPKAWRSSTSPHGLRNRCGVLRGGEEAQGLAVQADKGSARRKTSVILTPKVLLRFRKNRPVLPRSPGEGSRKQTQDAPSTKAREVFSWMCWFSIEKEFLGVKSDFLQGALPEQVTTSLRALQRKPV